MKYFLDTEFLEGKQDKRFCGIKYGETKPTIDLVSIGIVAEDGREYYAISRDFNLKEAWNRWQQRTGEGDRNNIEPRHYWIRENVLKPIFEELRDIEIKECQKQLRIIGYVTFKCAEFNYSNLKYLINKYGKTNKEIAAEVFRFVHAPIYKIFDDKISFIEEIIESAYEQGAETHEFYAYYADYDWVAFCWLFGKVLNLPKGFPMYCRDLKQIYDIINEQRKIYNGREDYPELKDAETYPKQINEHNALADAKWNFELYKFLIK